MKSNSEITRLAGNAMQGRWGYFAFMTLAVYLFTAVLQAPGLIVDGINQIRHVATPDSVATFGNAWSMVVSIVLLPLSWGYAILLLRNLRGEQYDSMDVFNGFRRTNAVMGTMLLVMLRVLIACMPFFVVSMLCATIPTFGKYISYAMIPAILVVGFWFSFKYIMTTYILYDTPLTHNAAIRESDRMMQGHKMQYFLLYLRLLPWIAVGVLTLGLGLLAVYPYIQTCTAAFYESLRTSAAPSEEEA